MTKLKSEIGPTKTEEEIDSGLRNNGRGKKKPWDGKSEAAGRPFPTGSSGRPSALPSPLSFLYKLSYHMI